MITRAVCYENRINSEINGLNTLAVAHRSLFSCHNACPNLNLFSFPSTNTKTQVEAAKAPEFEEIQVEATGLLGDDAEEVLINVAPKKANWDLRRDIATKLALLERRTQTAMIQLMQQEEKHRLEEAGGIQD